MFILLTLFVCVGCLLVVVGFTVCCEGFAACLHLWVVGLAVLWLCCLLGFVVCV